MRIECEQATDELAEIVAGDSAAIARHAEHLAGCDACRDARHEAAQLAERLAAAGAEYAAPADLLERVLRAVDAAPVPAQAPSVDAAPAQAPSVEAASSVQAASMQAAQASSVQAASMQTAQASSVQAAQAALTPAQAAPVSTQMPQIQVAPAPARSRPEKSGARKPVPVRAPRSRAWIALGATAALAAGGAGIYFAQGGGESATVPAPAVATGPIGTIKNVERAAADASGGIEVRTGDAWRALRKGEALPRGAEVRTDAFTRASLELADGMTIVLDHRTALAFDRGEPRRVRLAEGRVVAEVAPIAARPAAIETPLGRVDVLGTRFSVTATAGLTAVQVVRGAVALTDRAGKREEVRAGEEGSIEGGAGVRVSGAPGLHREIAWSELEQPRAVDEAAAGLGQLRAYKPGEQRDRDWNLALAAHDVKIRIVGPLARTEITETFRNDSDQTLEGVYQFPLPPDARIDSLELDVPGGFERGAFVDKARAQKIWRGVIDKATPKHLERPKSEIIWVPGPWRDPALLEWKRGGRFELRVFPIPGKGARTIKLAYTQVVTPRGPWRQYVYPLPHSADGSTVADKFTVDVEVRGAAPGMVRASGYDVKPDAARGDVNGLALAQSGFVPRGDLIVDYRSIDGDAELRAWTYAGAAAVAPDEKLAGKQRVGIDPAVVAAQRSEAADARPTAVLALRPQLPRWRESAPRDYAIVVDASQSMVGERHARAAQLAGGIVQQMDRRDRFRVLACDSECRQLGDLRAPSQGAASEVAAQLTAHPAAGASDVVGAIRAAIGGFAQGARGDRERWVMYVGDGFATTGFRRVADVERAIADAAGAVRVAAIGIGGDADGPLLAAVARGGGGSYVAWVPGQPVSAAAIASLESTYGNALRGATIELPAGLADVAPSILPTIRAGEEVLVAARVTGDVKGDAIIRGTVGGQPFERRYPLALAVSTSAGNGFVPRLWASLAIEQLERSGLAADRAKIVALSQGYGVMSRETSLLVLESPAMFAAFGVDRGAAAAKWTGDTAIEEVTDIANKTQDEVSKAKAGPRVGDKDGTEVAVVGGVVQRAIRASEPTGDDAMTRNPFDRKQPPPAAAEAAPPPAINSPPPPRAPRQLAPPEKKKVAVPTQSRPATTIAAGRRGMRGGSYMERTWVLEPAVSAYRGAPAHLARLVAASEAALADAPDSRERHRALVQTLAYAGEIPRALDVAAQWLARDPLDPQALGYRADLLGRAGDRELALRTLAGLVDLDADRAALHERLARAYDNAGRAAQACSHRVALAALAIVRDQARAAAGAARCLRAIGRTGDAELILRALPDDAARATAEKAATAAPAPSAPRGDLVLAARWTGGEDLDLSLILPDGSRASWQGGRADVRTSDSTSNEREVLAIGALGRGNYLVEIGRSTASTAPIRGTVEIAVLGERQTVAFELTGSRATIGQIAVALEARWREVTALVELGAVPHAELRARLEERLPGIRGCYESMSPGAPSLAGTLDVALAIDASGMVDATVAQRGPLAPVAACVARELTGLYLGVSTPQTIRVPLAMRRQ